MAPLRLAIIATPRSGNTWLRNLLMRLYGIPQNASHQLTDEDWGRMPPEVAYQIHWPRTDDFLARLAGHGFRVVTLARHPLDVLISILHFAWYSSETERWLLGRDGDESGLRGAAPRSRPFLDYATGRRAAALLSVTCDWWGRPGVLCLRYEDLVRDPAAGLAVVAESLGPPRGGSVADVVAECSIDRLRTHSTVNHFWQGRPGLWRDLLPAAEAGEIARAVAPVLDRLGYACDPDPALDARTADYNWVRSVGPELATTLQNKTAGHQAQLAWWDEYTRRIVADAEQARRERDAALAEAAQLRAELERRPAAGAEAA